MSKEAPVPKSKVFHELEEPCPARQTINILNSENEILKKINGEHCDAVNTYIGRVSDLEDEIALLRRTQEALLKRMSDLLVDLSPEDTIGFTNGSFWIDVATVEEIREAAYKSSQTHSKKHIDQ